MDAPDQNTQSTNGDLMVTLAMLIFGTYALFIALLPKIPIISFLFAMQAVGAIAYFFLARRKGSLKITSRAKWLLLALAVTATANDLTYLWAFRLTSVANASVAHQLVSIFLLFLAPWLVKERTKKSEGRSLALSLLGVAALFGGGISLSSKDAVGIALATTSALFYALIILIYRYMPTQGYTVDFMNFWRYTLSTVMLLPFVHFFGGFGVIYGNIWKLIAFGLLFAVIASRIHNIGISRTRPLHVSIIGKSEPVIATLYAVIFLRQVPTISALVGGALIVGASVWLAFDRT